MHDWRVEIDAKIMSRRKRFSGPNSRYSFPLNHYDSATAGNSTKTSGGTTKTGNQASRDHPRRRTRIPERSNDERYQPYEISGRVSRQNLKSHEFGGLGKSSAWRGGGRRGLSELRENTYGLSSLTCIHEHYVLLHIYIYICKSYIDRQPDRPDMT